MMGTSIIEGPPHRKPIFPEVCVVPSNNQPVRHEDKKAQKLIQRIEQRLAASKAEEKRQDPPQNHRQISLN
jgi:hypothetical protein